MHIWCKTLALLVLLYGGICEINSAECVFVCLIYGCHKVIFIGPVQIMKWWSFKCSMHLMQKKTGWKYDTIKEEVISKVKESKYLQ